MSEPLCRWWDLFKREAQTMADRYMYVSMPGLLIMAAWLIRDIVTKRHRLKVVVAALAAVALFSAIIITRTQVSYWENSTTLFEHTLKVTENNPIAENNYAAALLDEGRDNDALLHLLNAVRIDPKYFKARYRLGKLFLKQEKFNEAISCFTELLPHMKDSAELHYNLATALSRQKKYDEAIKHFTAVLSINPGYLDAHEKMGNVLLTAGRTAEAITHFNEALPVSANKADIYANLGTAYLLQGNNEMAIQSWTNSVQIKPNNVGNLNNLAWLLATRDEVSAEDAAKAVRFAEDACKLTEYKQPALLDTLSVAYAAAGRFDDAVAIANKAINAARTTGQESLANNIQDRIKLYQAGKRYREKMTSN